MKKIAFATVVFSFLFFALPAHGQESPKGDVAAGYSFFRLNQFNSLGGVNANGASFSADYNAHRWLGMVADFGVYHGAHGVTAETYTFGPRLWLDLRNTGKFTPFAQILFGGSHFQGRNPFTFSVGGGTDIKIGDSPFALRPQFDYLVFRGNDDGERFSMGIVYNFGSR